MTPGGNTKLDPPEIELALKAHVLRGLQARGRVPHSTDLADFASRSTVHWRVAPGPQKMDGAPGDPVVDCAVTWDE